MATKKVTAVIKLQCPAGAATPAPPIGPALGPHGVSAPKFVQTAPTSTSWACTQPWPHSATSMAFPRNWKQQNS